MAKKPEEYNDSDLDNDLDDSMIGDLDDGYTPPTIDPETGEITGDYSSSEESSLVPIESNEWEQLAASSGNLPDLASLANSEGVIELKSLRKAAGLPTEHIKPKELSGRPIEILALKKRMSTLTNAESGAKGAGYFYLALFQFAGETERYTTVIGGQVTLPILDMYAAMPEGFRLRCTLNHHVGGAFGQYYTLD